jgi:hypothetical protein
LGGSSLTLRSDIARKVGYADLESMRQVASRYKQIQADAGSLPACPLKAHPTAHLTLCPAASPPCWQVERKAFQEMQAITNGVD